MPDLSLGFTRRRLRRGTCVLMKFALLGVGSSVKTIVGVILSLMTLQMSSTRAQELERTAIFLQFCTGTRIADKIVLTAYHCLDNRIPKWASGGGVNVKVADYLVSPLARERNPA